MQCDVPLWSTLDQLVQTQSQCRFCRFGCSSMCAQRINPRCISQLWICVSCYVLNCLLFSNDIVGKLCTCVGLCRDQRHWAARISHNVLCKLVLFYNLRTHKHCSPWRLGVTSLYFSADISHKSGIGIQGKPCAHVHFLCDQTQTVANLSSILCIAARLCCMQGTCTPRLESLGSVSISQCSFAHM